jgi:hypothetical protein
MPCLIALVVLSVLGVFSASHRKLAREAFDCVFRRVTLRPCDTGFDVKVKASILGKFMSRSPKMAKFVNQRFELLAWIFFILITVSSVYSALGIYNWWAWGHCNGPVSGGFCAFDPTGETGKITSAAGECLVEEIALNALSLEDVDLGVIPTLNEGAEKELVMLGCYSCDFTRKTYPTIRAVVEKEAPRFTFAHFPTKKEETDYLLPYDTCMMEQGGEAYYRYVEAMFSLSTDDLTDEELVRQKLDELGWNLEELDECLADPEIQIKVSALQKEVAKTGVYGTPTIFVNGEPVVGPKPERVYRRLLGK